MVVFHQRSSSIKGRLFQRSSSINGRLPSKVVFHPKSSSINGRLPSKGVFHQKVSSVKGHLLSKVVFHRRSSSTKGRLPSTVDLILSVAQLSSAFHNMLPLSSLSNFPRPSIIYLFELAIEFNFSPECGIVELSLPSFVSLSWPHQWPPIFFSSSLMTSSLMNRSPMLSKRSTSKRL